jgi:hypothetical protein
LRRAEDGFDEASKNIPIGFQKVHQVRVEAAEHALGQTKNHIGTPAAWSGGGALVGSSRSSAAWSLTLP